MFCTKCGAQVPEGNAFCTKCGNKVGTAPAQQPVAPQSAKEKIDIAEKLKSVKLPKFDFVKSEDGEKKPFENPFAGNKPLLVKALALACVVLLLLSYVAAVNVSFDKIPIVSMVFTMADEEGEIEEMKEELEDLSELLQEGYEAGEDELKDVLSKREIKDLEKFIDAVADCAKKMSLHNFSKMMSRYEPLEDFDMDALGRHLLGSVEEAKEINSILGVIKAFLLIGALVCAVFVFFGGFKFKTGLAITGTVLTVLYGLSFCPFLMLLLNLAAQIYMIYVMKAVKKEKNAEVVTA